MRHFCFLMLLSGVALAQTGAPATNWPQWDQYRARFVDRGGRVVDGDALERTTSEGQAYAMFFALVANDRTGFSKLLNWTENNLAKGDLSNQLPAWLWGRSKAGDWEVLDDNSASDADLWLAFSLSQGGRIWGESRYRTLGECIARQIAGREVAEIPGLGKVLLPGPRGFQTRKDVYELNPSYVPMQVLLALAEEYPEGPWSAIASVFPRVLRLSSPNGFPLDWAAYHAGQGLLPHPVSGKQAIASYDAIRVYLWAGMLDPATPRKQDLLNAMQGMSGYLRRHSYPPAQVSLAGEIKDPNGSIGFSAAVIPFLESVGDEPGVAAQKQRLSESIQSPPTHAGYYDQSLILFSNGWSEGYFRFGPNGNLNLTWNVNRL